MAAEPAVGIQAGERADRGTALRAAVLAAVQAGPKTEEQLYEMLARGGMICGLSDDALGLTLRGLEWGRLVEFRVAEKRWYPLPHLRIPRMEGQTAREVEDVLRARNERQMRTIGRMACAMACMLPFTAAGLVMAWQFVAAIWRSL